MVDEVTTNNIIIFPTNSRGGKDTEIVDKVTNSNTNRFSAESKSSKIPTPDIKAIAKKFFDEMQRLANEVIENRAPEATFYTHRRSLLEAPLSGLQKKAVLQELMRLSKQPSVDRTMLPMINPELDQLKFVLNLCPEDNLIALHKAPNAQNIPPWSQQIRTLLTETPIVEGDRFMLGDNFADLYHHHIEMFMVHKRDSEPYWDIVDTATFVLDIADEEFRKEQEYDIKQSIELAQSKVPQKEITLNDLESDSLDSFNKKRLEKEYIVLILK